MAGPLPYDQLVLDQRELLIDQLARAVAGVQGRPLAAKPRTVEDEDAAWSARDPNVTPDHLATIAQMTAQELRQAKNDDGSPAWSPEQIATEVAARQMHAQYPYRQYTYTLGEGLDDLDAQIAKADRIAARIAKRQQAALSEPMAEAGWQPVGPEQAPPADGGYTA